MSEKTNLLTHEQIEDLLNYIGVEKIGMWKNDKIQFCCPIHKESNPSCGINASYQKDFHSPVVQVFNCFACHQSGKLDWFLYRSMPDKFKSFKKATDFIERRYGVLLNNPRHLKKVGNIYSRYEDYVNIEEPFKKVFPRTHLAVYKSGKETYKYYFERGFNKSDMQEYLVGRDLENKTVTFPVFWEDSSLAGIIGRYINPNRRHGERFKIYDSFNRGQLLYPVDKVEVDDTIILVESILDAQALRKWGYKNVLALMGSSLSQAQADYLIKHCSKVITLLDNDDGGRLCIDKIKKLLHKSVGVLYVDYPSQKLGKDPLEWGKDTTIKIINSAHFIKKGQLKRY